MTRPLKKQVYPPLLSAPLPSSPLQSPPSREPYPSSEIYPSHTLLAPPPEKPIGASPSTTPCSVHSPGFPTPPIPMSSFPPLPFPPDPIMQNCCVNSNDSQSGAFPCFQAFQCPKHTRVSSHAGHCPGQEAQSCIDRSPTMMLDTTRRGARMLFVVSTLTQSEGQKWA
jgi:hypothetical protein